MIRIQERMFGSANTMAQNNQLAKHFSKLKAMKITHRYLSL
jgi:hypothetical protein